MNTPKFQIFNGLKFTRDDSTGYYLNSTNRIRMHRYVWEQTHGEIPVTHEIHHIDHNKANNSIENLKMMEKFEHKSHHGVDSGRRNVESGHLDKIRPMTKEWHASKDGRKWHKDNYEKNKEKLHVEKEFKCSQCGKKFVSVDNGTNKFCSNACKSKWRRESGVDNEERECTVCGQRFTVNKYSKSKTCSFSCRSKFIYQNRKNKIN